MASVLKASRQRGWRFTTPLLPAYFRLQGTRPIVGWLRMGDGADLKSSPWTSNLVGPRACARTAHGTRGSLARWPPQSLPHQFAGRVSASANPRQRPRFRAYQPAYHPSAYRPRCKVLTGSHTPLSVRTRPRTASLHTVPKVRFGQVSVETPLETCGWKLRFSEVPKVRFRCYSGRYSRCYSFQQSALSPSTGLSTRAVNQSRKVRFRW